MANNTSEWLYNLNQLINCLNEHGMTEEVNKLTEVRDTVWAEDYDEELGRLPFYPIDADTLNEREAGKLTGFKPGAEA